MRAVLLAFFMFFICTCHANVTIKNLLVKSNPGDYIVTEQGGTYSVMIVSHMEMPHLIIQEISVAPSQINLKKIDWKKWVEEGASGATSWNSMAFDLNTCQLTQCYSHLERQWIFIEESDYFVKRLFELAFHPTKESERKKIGPCPRPGEVDRRRLWKPSLIWGGKKSKSADFEVMRCKWPKDKSKLSSCIFELYLDAKNPYFPFPYWMEVQHPHYTFKVRAIDSGSKIASPMPKLKLK